MLRSIIKWLSLDMLRLKYHQVWWATNTDDSDDEGDDGVISDDCL